MSFLGKEQLSVPLKAACLAKCNGAKVEVKQSGSFSLEDFREDILKVSRSETEHVIVSYSRKAFLQTGVTHCLCTTAAALCLKKRYGAVEMQFCPYNIPINYEIAQCLAAYLYLIVALMLPFCCSKMYVMTGDGHFSPVGGYHEGKDLVLILDTARFKYPPVNTSAASSTLARTAPLYLQGI